MTHSVWAGFYRKSVRERLDQLRLMFPELDLAPLESGGLVLGVADQLVENCVGIIGLPIGLGVGFVVNGREHVVPMAVEEPSIIAAVSAAAKLVAAHGGFETSAGGNVMIAQVQLLDLADPEAAADAIRRERDALVDEANEHCRHMQERGGGVLDVLPRVIPARRNPGAPMLAVHLHVDVREAMGANVATEVAERLAPRLAELTGARVGVRIISNLATERRATARFRVPIDALAWKGFTGAAVARQLLDAFRFADEDPYRATTHNKGVMNGIDAVAIATGQDWRAIEAAAHAWAARDGHYGSMTRYRLDGDTLAGELELPMAVATRGGVLHSHPTYRLTHGLLGNPDARTLAQIMVAVGLAQNLAALRALCTEGILRGHMALHGRNIARAAGAPVALVPEVTAYMSERGRVDLATAEEYLRAHAIFQKAREAPTTRAASPSTLYLALPLPELDEPLVLNVAIETVGPAPRHVEIEESLPPTELQRALLGEKGLAWLAGVFATLDRIRLTTHAPSRTNRTLQDHLKLVSILLNVVLHRLALAHPEPVRGFVARLLERRPDLLAEVPEQPETLAFGLPLVLGLHQVLEHAIAQWVSNPALAQALRVEQRAILEALVAEPDTRSLEAFMRTHRKRWQATFCLLCDALSIPDALLGPRELDAIVRLGECFEWECTLAHDRARPASGQRNVYAEPTLHPLIEAALEPLRSTARATADAFERGLFERTVEAIHAYYRV